LIGYFVPRDKIAEFKTHVPDGVHAADTQLHLWCRSLCAVDGQHERRLRQAATVRFHWRANLTGVRMRRLAVKLRASASTVRRLSPSWNQFQGLGKARTNSDSTKVAPVGRQDSINASSFSNCSHGAINQTEFEPCKSCIQFHGSRDVGRERQLVLVSCSRIEYIRDQPSHGCAVVPEKVVNLGENEPRHDYRTR